MQVELTEKEQQLLLSLLLRDELVLLGRLQMRGTDAEIGALVDKLLEAGYVK